MAFCLLHCTSQLRPSLTSKYLRGTKVESRGQSASRFAAFHSPCVHVSTSYHEHTLLKLSPCCNYHIISVGISPSFRPISSVHILALFYLGSALSFFHFVWVVSCFSCSAFLHLPVFLSHLLLFQQLQSPNAVTSPRIFDAHHACLTLTTEEVAPACCSFCFTTRDNPVLQEVSARRWKPCTHRAR